MSPRTLLVCLGLLAVAPACSRDSLKPAGADAAREAAAGPGARDALPPGDGGISTGAPSPLDAAAPTFPDAAVPPGAPVRADARPAPDALVPATVTTLTPYPKSLSLLVGQIAGAQLLAGFSDGSQREVSGDATWSVADTAVARVTTAGLFGARIQGLAPGSTVVSASYGGRSATIPLVVQDPVLEDLGVEPDRPIVEVGKNQPLVATAFFSGAQRDVSAQAQWVTSDPMIATIDGAGLATCRAAGAVTVTATFQGKTASTLLVCAHDRMLSGLLLQPPTLTLAVDDSTAFTVLAIFSDGSAEDVSGQATLTSANPAIAGVKFDSQVVGIAPGTVTVKASYMGQEASATVVVISDVPVALEVQPPMAALRVGQTLALMLAGIFKDGHSDQVDADSWTSSNPMVATVDASGSVTALAPGSATITAKLMGLAATAAITVTMARLDGLHITPADPHAHAGDQIILAAIAHYSDGTSADVSEGVVWSSSDARVAVVEGTSATLTALAPGTTVVTALYPGAMATVTVTVDPGRPKQLVLSPASLVLAVGEILPLQAVLIYDDGTSGDVTGAAIWRSNDTNTAEVDSSGLVTADAPGTAVVTATLGSLTSTAAVTVSAATVKSVTVTPPMLTVMTGQTRQLTLVAQLDDGTTRDVTARATWVSSNPAVAVVSNGGSTPGLVTAAAPGSATITGTYQGQHAAAAVTVP